MKKILNKIIALSLVAIALLAIAGCGSKEQKLTAQITLDEMSQQIQKEVEFRMMMPISADDENSLNYLKDSIGMDFEWLNQYVFHSNVNISADSLLIAEAKTADKVADIEKAFEKYKVNVIQSFENYLPEPLEVAKNGEIATKGNYVMLVISKDNAKAIEVFKSNIK